MKIIAHESSRITILFPLEEIIPLGGVSGRDIIEKIRQRYEFLKVPDAGMTREEAAKSGYKFGTGQILLKGMKDVIIEFAVYSDGIVADARTSDVAEPFLDDVIQFMKSELGFREFSSEPKRFFYSQLVVEFKKPLEKLFPSFDKISGAISRRLDPMYKIHVPISFARLDLEVEKTLVPAPAPKFIIERRAGIAFDKERYYTSAPMRTADHVAVLEEIENSIN